MGAESAAGGMGIGNYIGAGVLSTTGIVQFAIAMDQAKKDAKKADEMFVDSPEFKKSAARAADMAKSGYTQDEINAYMLNESRLNNTRYTKGVQAGGNNFANQVQQGINYGSMKSLLDFAAGDAALKRQNVRYADTFALESQRRSDMNTQRQMALRDKERDAIAGLANAGVQNVTSSGAMVAGGQGDPQGTGADKVAPVTNYGTTGIGNAQVQPQNFEAYQQPQRGNITYDPNIGYAQSQNNYSWNNY
jgi:hypothetical protein